jgi:triacylglycerol lipase
MVVTDPPGRLVLPVWLPLFIRPGAPQPGLIQTDSLYHAGTVVLFTGMLTLREPRAEPMPPVDVPRALLLRGYQSISYVARRNARYPVLLVHGYASNESVWTPLRRALAGAGFGHIVSVSYNSVLADPAAVTAELTDQGLQAAAAAGAPGVHLVGHSLGGLIVRCALTASAPLSSRTASAVTIASPHRGAWLARLAPGRFAPLMHRGGCPDRPEADAPDRARPDTGAPAPARWLAYYADRDRVVPAASARLDDPRYAAVNLPIPGCGHLTICRDARLIRSLVSELIRSETSPDPATPARAGRELMAA